MYKAILADDEEWIVENLRDTIDWNKYGFEVVDTALDGTDALEKIRKWNPDIVFTDIRMPGINGLELIKRVSDSQNACYFVVISGFAEFAYAQKALEYGATGYILKPLEDEDIIRMLGKVKLKLDAGANTQAEPEITLPGDHYSDADYNNIKNETARELFRHINENFQKTLTLQDLSDKFNINPCYVSQLFRKETGKSFLEYLTGLRMDYACKMLRSTSLSVNTVAEKTGYEDSLYFRKIFKKVTGMTPTEYREGDAEEKK